MLTSFWNDDIGDRFIVLVGSLNCKARTGVTNKWSNITIAKQKKNQKIKYILL